MARRDPQRTQKLRIAVRYLLERECMAKGNQTRLAEHFKVSRQRVHQIVVEERQRFQHIAASNGAILASPAVAQPSISH
jgi:predicted XRE-type DNA-binding protein